MRTSRPGPSGWGSIRSSWSRPTLLSAAPLETRSTAARRARCTRSPWPSWRSVQPCWSRSSCCGSSGWPWRRWQRRPCCRGCTRTRTNAIKLFCVRWNSSKINQNSVSQDLVNWNLPKAQSFNNCNLHSAGFKSTDWLKMNSQSECLKPA